LGSRETDITDEHILLGYKPLILGSGIDLGEGEVQIQVRQDATILAEMIIKKVGELLGLFLYEGVQADLKLSSTWRRVLIEWRENMKNKGSSNIELDRSLYKQVIAAYYIPRAISIIAVRKHASYNEFPTDLHGPYGEESYVSSLRIGGCACAQVMETKSIKLYSMSLGQLEMVYNKGKNHMRDWRNGDHPHIEGAISYKILDVQGYEDAGLHRVFAYRIVEDHSFNSANAELAHCHREYIQWRLKNRIPTKYVLRSPANR
jgi:hypothetical protein